MCDENIEIGVTEITNNILVSAQPTDQIIDINVLETTENVELTITPSVVEVNIDVTQELITEVVTVDANTCVNIVDVTVTDATDNVTLNITPSLVEVNINRGENNLSIEEYDSFADLPTIGNTDTYYITLDDNKFWRWDSIDEVYVEISSADDRIPYLGAIKNSDLGEWGIKTNWLGLDTTPTNPPTAVGTLTWNDVDGTADLILKGGNVTLQIGQENVVRVVNKTGATLNEADFRAVRVRLVSEGGAQGQRLAVLLAQGNNDHDSATTIGLVTETIANNAEGFITISGNVSEINTTGAKSWAGAETWVDGDILYLSPDHAGYLTNVKPVAPKHLVVIGYVVYAHANHGKIFVKVDNGYELDELHNVLITSPINQGLVYDSSLSVWKNASIQLPLSATSPLSIATNVISISQANSTTNGYLSASDWILFNSKQGALTLTTTGSSGSSTLIGSTLNIPTYTLAGLGGITATFLSGGTGISYNSSTGVISYSGTVYTNSSIRALFSGTAPITYNNSTGAIGITQANATTDGYVSASDWNYFSAKQQPLSGTGFVKATGSVISYDNTVYTPQSRTLTINGTSYDLSADRSWSISVGSGMRNVSSFVATSGQTTFTIVGGYTAGLVDVFVNGTRLNASDYTATNGTTVVLGTGLVANDIVDIINYTASLTSGITGSGTAGYLPLWSGSSNLTNSIVRQDANGVYVDFATGTKVFKVTKGVIASQDGGLYAGSGYQLVFADYGSAEYAAIEGSSFSGASSYIRFLTNASEQMRLTSSGNLGLGYSSPRAKLDVNGYVYSGGFWTTNDSLGGAFYIGDLATGASYTYISGKGTSSTNTYLSLSTNNTERLRFESNGNFTIPWLNQMTQIMNYDNTYRMGTLYQANARTLTFYSCGGDANPSISFNTRLGTGASSTDYGTERMRITSAGNVGIGTSSPTIYGGGMEISRASQAGLRVSSTGGTSPGGIEIGHESSVGGFIQTVQAGGQITFYTGNASTTAMRITSAGRVGIGTTSPQTFLHVADGNTGTKLMIEDTYGGNGRWGLGAGIGGLNDTHFTLKHESSSTTVLTATPSGNVGIGTTSPNAPLSVVANSSGYSIYSIGRNNTDNASVISFRSNNSATEYAWIESSVSNQLDFGTNGNYRMRIASNGKVGIGTTNPTEKLNVYTNELIWGIDIQHGYTASNQYYIAFRNSAGSQTGNIQGNGSSTSYNTTSDYRLKEDLKPIKGLEQVSKINVYDFKFKNSSNRMDGVLAHELQEVLPFAVTGIKDGKDMQSVDYSKIVPVLVQAIKELNAKIEAK